MRLAKELGVHYTKILRLPILVSNPGEDFMMNTRRLFYRMIALLTLLMTLSAFGAQIVRAQENLPPTLQIVAVDTTNFPQLEIALSGTNLPAALDSLPTTVTLDGHPLTIVHDELTDQAIQLAIAIDANGLVTRNVSGQSGYVEMTGTLLDLVEANVFVRNEDWLAVYQLQGDNQPLPIQEWTQEPNLIFNSTVGQRPPEVSDQPLSAQAIIAMMKVLANQSEAQVGPKVLLLFSTGATITDLTPVISAAQEQQIAIHTVELLNGSATPQSDTLQQLAAQSGGHYTALNSPELSATVGEALTAAHTVRILRGRTDSATPQTLTVAITLPDDSTIQATAAANAFAGLTVTPVQIAVTTPATASISWQDLANDPNNAEARLLPLQSSLTWPDGHPRNLVQVSYTLRGPADFAQQAIRIEAPFDQATLSVAELAEGEYTLEILALDELGIEATSVTTPIRFTDLPATGAEPAVAAAPSAAAVAQPAQETSNGANSVRTGAEATTNSGFVAQPTALPAEPADSVLIPGLQIALPRSLLLWSLPVLLFLIGYLIYSERRGHRQQQEPRQKALDAPFVTAEADDPLFDLRNEAQPRAGKRYQLNSTEQNHTKRYSLEEDGSPSIPPLSERGPGKGGRRDMAPEIFEEQHGRQEAVATWQERDRLVWDEEDDLEEEITVTPARMEDEEATYRTEEVARPLLGYLMRTTSDPNLPKELPIYGLNPAPGELRQIHIGRHSKHNTVVINDKSISREHAVIIQRDGRLYLRDNASTAGTFLNWKRLNPGEELLLRHNDLISFGQIAYEFRLHGEDEATVRNG